MIGKEGGRKRDKEGGRREKGIKREGSRIKEGGMEGARDKGGEKAVKRER